MSAPPWSLTGDGFIWLFRFPRAFVLEHGFLAPWQREALRETLGAVILVRYTQSGVGPYDELLCIPGRFAVAGARHFSISVIYVSTEASVRWGIANWGIPKQQAQFERQQMHGEVVFSCATTTDEPILSARLRPLGLPFPVASALVPFRIAQRRGEEVLITHPRAVGRARLCTVSRLAVNPAHFPDIARLRPLAVLAVESFRMTFPHPVRLNGAGTDLLHAEGACGNQEQSHLPSAS